MFSGAKEKVFNSHPENAVTESIKKYPPLENMYSIQIQKGNFEPVMHNGQDLNEIIYIILNTLQSISKVRFYGVTVLIDVLSGKTTEKVSRAKLDIMPEYGKLSEISKGELRLIIDWLITNHFILKTKGQYPVLHQTYDGVHYGEKMTQARLKQLKRCLEMNG